MVAVLTHESELVVDGKISSWLLRSLLSPYIILSAISYFHPCRRPEMSGSLTSSGKVLIPMAVFCLFLDGGGKRDEAHAGINPDSFCATQSCTGTVPGHPTGGSPLA